MRPVQAHELKPCDVIYAHGSSQIITGLRNWRGVVTATLAGAPPVSWPESNQVLTSQTSRTTTRGEGINR